MRDCSFPKDCVVEGFEAVDRLAKARWTARVRSTAKRGSERGPGGAKGEFAWTGRWRVGRGSLSLYSGNTFAIRPQHWAREIALTWLEQGECLLTEDFVYPWPLSLTPSAQSVGSPESIPPEPPSLRRGERATIFVSEHDCQRLMAQQATEENPLPSDQIADVEARAKDKGGRPLQPEGASAKKRGRKKGDGSYAAIDLPLLSEMKELILSHRAASPEEAARMLAEKAFGPGSLESKAERLAKRYRERERPNSLGSGS